MYKVQYLGFWNLRSSRGSRDWSTPFFYTASLITNTHAHSIKHTREFASYRICIGIKCISIRIVEAVCDGAY